MAELEDTLNALLSDPNSMAQVMQMAQQISSSMGQGDTEETAQQPQQQTPSIGGLDPQLLTRLMPLLQEYQQGGSRSMQLLMALRPYLKPEKQEKVARAAQLSHLIHVGKKFLLERGNDHV